MVRSFASNVSNSWSCSDATRRPRAQSPRPSPVACGGATGRGVAAAVARSGLLLRLGLLLIERVPARPAWQSAAFLVTGIVLTPLLPLAMARAAITAPLAEGVSDTMKLTARGPASATL